jgi:hypothetical protein
VPKSLFSVIEALETCGWGNLSNSWILHCSYLVYFFLLRKIYVIPLILFPNHNVIWLTGDFRDRICTAAEIRYYFHGFVAQGASSDNYVEPNKNCNLTSWVDGCEPGWGCSTGNNIDLKKDIKEIPKRTKNCQPCCEGFFCPQGLTCMIRKYVIPPEMLLLIRN